MAAPRNRPAPRGVTPVVERGPAEERWFRGVYEATYRDLLAYARRRCANSEDADDLVAEVFTIAWRRLEDLPHGDDARLWLFGVARNVLSNQRRSGRRAASFLARYRPAASADAAPGASDPRVAKALGALSEPDREILRLVAWEELTVAQAAVVLDISTASAESRLRRARARLARRLAEVGVQRTPVKGGDR